MALTSASGELSLVGCLVSDGGCADELSVRRAEVLWGAADMYLFLSLLR